ncbi:MAG TPA: LytTR family DNA-binding domain-containing protein [Bacteroidia bacterium]|jgi:DNA-binding LytR/AlgR family response regulator|nr:LytTR family DNA-binding domain-containing protein [Bacteroidia bacterium]
MINAIAIDDEPLALKVIENFCEKVSFINLQKTFNKPNEALHYTEKFPVDLLFLDINMPSINGIEFYKQLQQSCMVIFTTAYSEYAIEGFNLNAVDYILKPFTFDRFMLAVNKAQDFFNYQNQKENTSQFLFVRADYSLIKINITNILYIEGLDDYLKIHIENQKTIVTRMTMKSMLEKLSPKDFVRVHRSFIVPLSRVQSVRNKIVSIAGIEIPIGASYEENFFNQFTGNT